MHCYFDGCHDLPNSKHYLQVFLLEVSACSGRSRLSDDPHGYLSPSVADADNVYLEGALALFA